MRTLTQSDAHSLNSSSGVVADTSHKSITPLSAATLSCVVVAIVDAFGPYRRHVYSSEGMFYYILVMGLLLFGMAIGRIPLRAHLEQPRVRILRLSSRQRALLASFSIISIACCIYLTSSFFRYYGASYVLFGGAYLEFADTERGVMGKIATVFLQSGTAAFLIDSISKERGSKAYRRVIVTGFWTTGIYYLVQGSRFAAATSLLIYAFSSTAADRKARIESVKTMSKSHRVFVISLGLVLFAIFLRLFKTRAIYHTAIDSYEFTYSDKVVRKAYLSLYQATNGAVDPLYSLLDYIGEAPYVFTYFYSFYLPSKVYFCTNLLRSVSKLTSLIGAPIIKDSAAVFAELGGGSGKYSGCAWPLLIDFGIYLAPIVAFSFGVITSKIEIAAQWNPFCKGMLPCLIVAMLFSPIYYITVGRIDYVLLWYFTLWVLVRLVAPSNRLSTSKKRDNYV